MSSKINSIDRVLAELTQHRSLLHSITPVTLDCHLNEALSPVLGGASSPGADKKTDKTPM